MHFFAFFEEEIFTGNSYPSFLPVSFPYVNLGNIDGKKNGGEYCMWFVRVKVD